MVDRHPVSQHSTDELGIVPIFGVELLRESLDSGLVATFVLKLEVVAALSVLVCLLDYLSLGDCLWKHDAFLVVLQTCEDFIRIALKKTYEGHPLLLVVLETHHIAVENLGSYFCHLWRATRTCCGLVFLLVLFLVFFRHCDHDSAAAAVAVDGATLASGAPCLHIEFVDERLVDIVWQVHSDADGMVDPLLDSSLHLYLHKPVNVIGCGFIIRRTGNESVYLFLRIAFG